MTTTTATTAPTTTPDYETLAARFRPLFDRIAAGASAREQEHRLPHDEIRELAAAGFGALRVPAEFGGAGATLPQTFRLLTELAAADSNIPQALRGHFALVEDRLVARSGSVTRGSSGSAGARSPATPGPRSAPCRSAT